MLLYIGDKQSHSSSGSIVSDYGLDNREIEVRSPTWAEDFSSSPCVQIGSGAYPASYPMGTMGTGGPVPGGKARPGRDANHSPPSSAEVRSRNYTSSPPMLLHGMFRYTFTFLAVLEVEKKR
jgi:hypothetical protein